MKPLSQIVQLAYERYAKLPPAPDPAAHVKEFARALYASALEAERQERQDLATFT